MRKSIDYMVITLKGMAMGAADVVPGVSGGTIAFITGIYEELLDSIKAVDGSALKLLAKGKPGQFWKKINGNFLGSLLAGIAISIFSLARLMTYLLENQPILIWAFFFGLIIASTILIGRQITRWEAKSVVGILCGAASIVLLSLATPASTPQTWWFALISGAVAVCAMILPGISGAFILLLLGQYRHIMESVAGVDLVTITAFVVGAVAGITAFSRFLSWLLGNYRNVTMSVLTGILFGSLYKIWPWKETVEWYTDSHGAAHPLVEKNILPGDYAGNPQIWGAVALAAAGLALILIIEWAGRKIGEKRRAAGL